MCFINDRRQQPHRHAHHWSDRPAPGDRPGEYDRGAETITFDKTVFNTPKTITLNGNQLELSDTTGTETITGPAAGVTVSGGGLSRVFQVDASVTASISGLTISGGSASSGGGLFNSGTATLTNCTVSGNSANGGVGGGLYIRVGTSTLTNTIVAGNTNSSGASDILNLFADVSGSYNLIGTGGSGGLTNGVNGNIVLPSLTNLGLVPLGHYGGPTQTMPLLPGSPAIDAGNNALIPTGVTTDSRGDPRLVNGTVDIRAFESCGFTIAVTSGSGQSTDVSTAFSAPLVVTVTANNPSEPVAGGLVTFTPPPSGASATISGSPATISGTGTASATATANRTGGGYTVSATASGITTPASFSLTNNRLVPTFGALASPSIVYGTSTTTLTGHLGSGAAFPTGSSVSITLNSVTQTAQVDGSGNFTTTFSTASLGVAGGPYTVTYAFAGNQSFGAATDTSTTLTVTKANETVVVTPYSVTYDGGAHTATYTITGVNGETGSAVGVVTLSTTHTNAGTYSDSWSFTGANYNDIASTKITDTINMASSTVVVTINGGPFTYTGLAQTPATVLVTGAGGLNLTPTASYTNNVKAGLAAASYTYAGDANHTGGADSKNFTINKADATFTVTPYTVTYDGTPHTATVTSITGVNGETGSKVGTTTLNTTHTNGGVYSDSWSFAGAANYKTIASTTITDTINKANATVVVTPYTVKFDGSPHTATITSITGVNGETGAAVGSVTLNTSHTNAGTYSDSWSFTGAANYNDIASTPITDAISSSVYLSPDTADRTAAFMGLSPQQRFIQALYLDELGRAGSVAELNGWVAVLNGAPNGPAVVEQGIENSAEGRDNLVKGWYRSYLGRTADGVEEQSHVAGLLAGFSEETILGGILGSPEFFLHAQTLTNSGSPPERFVQALYKLLLNRTADAGEITGHVAELRGGQTEAQVAENFLLGLEFRTDLVALYYSTLLHRTASADEINGWAASGMSDYTIRLMFESSPEFLANG
ncbi:MAG TPA: hypothetical protein DDY78_09800 [Planctomycetales bacterium]|nr:hypothetical protein [Planctomycetales bacterium]